MAAPPPAYGSSGHYPNAPPPGYVDPGYPPQGAAGAYPPQTGYPPPGAYPPPTNYGAYGGYGPGYPPPQGGYTNTGYGSPAQHGHAQPKPEETERSAWQEDGWTGQSFSSKAIRHAFIRKVYLILMTQLLVTFTFVCFFTFHEPTKYWVQRHSWFYWVSYAVFLVTYITLACCTGVRRKFPGNFICLAVFTLAFSYVAATISSYYNTEIVMIAVGITAAVCLAITLFAIQTKIDFTMCSGLIFAASMVLLLFGLGCMIWYFVFGFNRILQVVYGSVAALVFSLFLAYDTQMLIGGRKHELSPEEYIFGALQLYIDVVYLFLIILSLFGRGD